MTGTSEGRGGGRRHMRTALPLMAAAAGMLGLAFASVPLYRIFCQATGYNGTTQQASVAPGAVADWVTIRFDANVDPGLSWTFRPDLPSIRTRIGESTLAFYRASNPSSEAITGTASFNVTPEIAGQYFNKIECFCFTEQTLAAGETVEMPVSFFVDPAILKDPEARGVGEITLSYTFYRSETAVGAGPGAPGAPAGG